MIKINLYPYKKKTKTISFELELGLYGLVLILVSAILIYVNITLNSKIDQLSKVKSQKQYLNNILKKKVRVVSNYKKHIKILNRKIKVIRQIREDQNLPVIYLTELVKKFIKDKLWFTNLSLNSQKRISLAGVALDNQILAQYIKNLRSSRYVKEVYLKRAVKKKIMGFDLISFNFNVETTKDKSNTP